MPYLGQTKMGQGTPIPINPTTGDIDINALVGMLTDQRKDTVYDTLTLLPGTTVTSQPYRMFQIPIGQTDFQTGQVKTELETNMRSQGMFSPPYDFIMNNLGFYLSIGADLFDVSTLFSFAWFELDQRHCRSQGRLALRRLAEIHPASGQLLAERQLQRDLRPVVQRGYDHVGEPAGEH